MSRPELLLCSFPLSAVSAGSCLVSRLFGSKFMSAWINTQLNHCGCEDRVQCYLAGMKPTNAIDKIPQRVKREECETSFVAGNSVSLHIWCFKREKKDPEAPWNVNTKLSRDHKGHIIWCIERQTLTLCMHTHKEMRRDSPLLCYMFLCRSVWASL